LQGWWLPWRILLDTIALKPPCVRHSTNQKKESEKGEKKKSGVFSKDSSTFSGESSCSRVISASLFDFVRKKEEKRQQTKEKERRSVTILAQM
jgi:hypothetical protein